MSLPKELTEAMEGAIENLTAIPEDTEGDGGELDSSEGEEGALENQEALEGSGGVDDEEGDGDGEEGDGGAAEDEDEDGEGEDGEGEAEEGVDDTEEISPQVIEAAVRAGISLKDAMNWRDEASLIAITEKLVAKTAEAQDKAKEKQDESKEDEKDFLDGFPELSPDDYDPEIIKAFDGMKAALRQQHETIQKLQETQKESASAVEEARAKEVENWFDAQVAALDDDSKSLLGTGRYSELDKKSKEFIRREEIAKHMSILLNGYRASGVSVPPREDVFDTAVAMVLAKDLQDVNSTKLKKSLKDRSKLHIQRAKGGKAKVERSPMEEVVEKIKKKFPGI